MAERPWRPRAGDPPRLSGARPRIETDKLTAMYGKFTAVKNVSLGFAPNQVHALIGPSGCGKSTFLRTLNRMHELSEGGWITGQVLLDGEDIYAPRVSAMQLRRRVGMVFQKPDAVPDHVDLRQRGRRTPGERPAVAGGRAGRRSCERSLRQAALWDEVKDRLHDERDGALGRTAAAALHRAHHRAGARGDPARRADRVARPQGTQRIEELVFELKRDFTIVIVTHNMQQAARVSDTTTLLLPGHAWSRPAPPGRSSRHPANEQTEAYITGTVRMTHAIATPGFMTAAPRPTLSPRAPDRRRARDGPGDRGARLPLLVRRAARCSRTSTSTSRAGRSPRSSGPSGCGKSTFLRSINRLNDLIPGTRHKGDILVDGASVFDRGTDLVALRQRVGMVFQRPNPFPKSIFDNVAYGPALNALVPKRRPARPGGAAASARRRSGTR